MNLPLYYRRDFLSHILAKHGVEFSLYSANDQMTPSFRRVYERGKNLGLKWFKQLNTIGTAKDNAKAVGNTDIEDDAIAGINVDTEPDIGTYINLDIETDTNSDSRRAVRNLLQLIYKHHFLPEVHKNETLVTNKISKVLNRNKRLPRKETNLRKPEILGIAW